MTPFTWDQLLRVVDWGRADSKKDTLARVGEALLLTQSVEKSLRFVMTFVIKKGGDGLNLERLESQRTAERDKTIGYFLSQLRFRVDVEPDTNARLSAFLELRNKMVHRLEEVPGWGLDGEESLKTANDFLSLVLAHGFFLFMWLAGIVKSWQDQVGFETEFDGDEAVKMIDRYFAPYAEWSIAPKSMPDPLP